MEIVLEGQPFPDQLGRMRSFIVEQFGHDGFARRDKGQTDMAPDGRPPDGMGFDT